MDEFEIVGKFVLENGLSLVISIIVVWILFKVADIGIEFLRSKALASGHKNLLEKRHVTDVEIQHMIDRSLYSLNGDRIIVMEFHNSVQNLSFLPFLYMTCNYETFKSGLLPVGNTLKQISASLFSIFLTELYKKEFVVIDGNSGDTGVDKAAFILLGLQDESSALCVLIKDAGRKPLGVIILKRKERFTRDDANAVREIAGRIGSLLCVNKSIFEPK